MALICNPCGELRWSPKGPVSQIHSPRLHVGAPRMFLDLLKSVQMRKREWGAESKGKLPQLSNPSKTTALIPEFAVEGLPLGRTAALVPEFAVKHLSFWQNTLTTTTMMMMMITLKVDILKREDELNLLEYYLQLSQIINLA